MNRKYRAIFHAIVDSGLVLTAFKILEFAFYWKAKQPDLDGRTNETYRVFNQSSVLIAVSS